MELVKLIDVLDSRKISISKLSRMTDLSREGIRPALEGDYSASRVSTLQAIADALPGIELVIGFREVTPDAS